MSTLRELVIGLRGTADGYDIAVGGEQRWEDENKQLSYLESLAAEGVTWFVVSRILKEEKDSAKLSFLEGE